MRWTGPDGFEADDAIERVDVDVMHDFLNSSYWATGIPREVVARSIAGSLNVGVYAADGSMVAFARAVTDRATFAWIADVFVVPARRGHGLGKFVVSTLLDHPELTGVRRFMLSTRDAQELYRGYGFAELVDDTSSTMVIRRTAAELYGAN